MLQTPPNRTLRHSRTVVKRAITGRGSMCVALVLLVSSAIPALAAKPSTPVLRFVTVPHYRLTVVGTGWPQQARVVLALHAGPWVVGDELRTTKSGAFRVGVNNVDLCGGVTFLARDLARHRATLRGPALMCPSPVNPPVPKIMVLIGKQTQPHEIRIYSHAFPKSAIMYLGEKLYVWEPGTLRPFYDPKVDENYLALSAQGRTPPRLCPQPDCDAGFYWEWVAVRSGRTLVDMSPSCLQSKPACALPDFAIQIQITR